MNKAFDFKQNLYNKVKGMNIHDLENTLDNMEDIDHTAFIDSGFYDGIDDEECEDKHIMYASYDIFTKGGETYHVIFYYGDNTEIISDLS